MSEKQKRRYPLEPNNVIELQHALGRGIGLSGVNHQQVDEWISQSCLTQEVVATMLRLGLHTTWMRLRHIHTGQPTDLAETLEGQVKRLIEIEANEQLGLSKKAYRKQLEVVVKSFRWSEHLAGIGLVQVALIDYRISEKVLAQAGRLKYPFEGTIDRDDIRRPKDRVLVVQCQYGHKYHETNLHYCPMAAEEESMTLKEGLTIFLYEGTTWLKRLGQVDLDGSKIVELNESWGPALALDEGKPQILSIFRMTSSRAPLATIGVPTK